MMQQDIQSSRSLAEDTVQSGDSVYFNYRDERALSAFAGNPAIRDFARASLTKSQVVVSIAPEGELEFATGPFIRACMPASWFTKLPPNVEDPRVGMLTDPLYGKC
jgi:hypothetical protein